MDKYDSKFKKLGRQELLTIILGACKLIEEMAKALAQVDARFRPAKKEKAKRISERR